MVSGSAKGFDGHFVGTAQREAGLTAGGGDCNDCDETLTCTHFPNPHEARGMTTNRKKLLLPDTMGRAGWDLLKGRDDIDAVRFPNTSSPAEFQALVHDASGVALSATPFREPELAAAPRMAVDGGSDSGRDRGSVR